MSRKVLDFELEVVFCCISYTLNFNLLDLNQSCSGLRNKSSRQELKLVTSFSQWKKNGSSAKKWRHPFNQLSSRLIPISLMSMVYALTTKKKYYLMKSGFIYIVQFFLSKRTVIQLNLLCTLLVILSRLTLCYFCFKIFMKPCKPEEKKERRY